MVRTPVFWRSIGLVVVVVVCTEVTALGLRLRSTRSGRICGYRAVFCRERERSACMAVLQQIFIVMKYVENDEMC